MDENIIKVSQDGVDVSTATGAQVLFSAASPFAMLDTQNKVSFQNINLFFTKDVPFIDGGTTKTLVYQFPHGYSYVPQTWLMYQNQGSPGNATGFTYGYENSTIVAESIFTFVVLKLEVDTTNVNLYVIKTFSSSGGDTNPNIEAFTLQMRIYVFVQDLLT